MFKNDLKSCQGALNKELWSTLGFQKNVTQWLLNKEKPKQRNVEHHKETGEENISKKNHWDRIFVT